MCLEEEEEEEVVGHKKTFKIQGCPLIVTPLVTAKTVTISGVSLCPSF